MDQVWLWVALALLVVAVAVVLLLRGRGRNEELAGDGNEAMSTAAVAAAGGAVGAVGAAGVAAAAASRAETADADPEPDEGEPAEPPTDRGAPDLAERPGEAPADAEPSGHRSAPLGSALAALDGQSAATARPSAFELAAAAVSAEVTRPGPYEGSVLPAADGSAPSPEYPVKANVGSRRFYQPDSPYYVRTRADLWFRTVADAEGAGFTG